MGKMKGSDAWKQLAGKFGGAGPMYVRLADYMSIHPNSARRLASGDYGMNAEKTRLLLEFFSTHLGGAWKITEYGVIPEGQEVVPYV